MPPRHLLVLAVDGLRASALGAYGNTTFPTPSLDEFAAESFLFDWCYTPSEELAGVYRALWQSQNPHRKPGADERAPSLAQLLSDRGYCTQLITDDPELAKLPLAEQFDQCVQVGTAAAPGAAATRAGDVADTALAHVIAAACDAVAAISDAAPRLVWLHARGMYGPWDAPLDLQQSLLDENDPPPVESTIPPDFTPADGDPDVAFRYGCAYAAQIMVLDACWNILAQTIDSTSAAADWLVMLLGTRGYPLGEHGRIGGADARLYGEQLHVPWLVRFPHEQDRFARCAELTSPLDVLPTLLEWVDGPHHQQPANLDGTSTLPLAGLDRPTWRDALVANSDSGAFSIRTAEWCLRHDAADPAGPELYVRPDDRWEMNDVAKLCPDVVENLQHRATAASASSDPE